MSRFGWDTCHGELLIVSVLVVQIITETLLLEIEVTFHVSRFQSYMYKNGVANGWWKMESNMYSTQRYSTWQQEVVVQLFYNIFYPVQILRTQRGHIDLSEMENVSKYL
jgi:hypothetical protein